MGKKHGSILSWKKVTGVTKLKRGIAKTTGIPTTKSGRKRKVKRTIRGLFGFK
jgi:hypothetical protein